MKQISRQKLLVFVLILVLLVLFLWWRAQAAMEIEVSPLQEW